MSNEVARTRFGRTLIIANPAAQEGEGERIGGELHRFLTLYLDDDGPFDLVYTEAPGHAVELAAGAAGYDTVLSLGGDGAIHEVANGLMRLPEDVRPVLGLVPAGSGNDYARTLGITDCKGKSFQWLLSCAPVPMDVGSVGGVAADGTALHECYVQTCSFGLDAAIALGTVDLRETTPFRGDLLYSVSGLDVFVLKYRHYPVEVRFDDREPFHLEELVFAMQIGQSYGSGFKICPEADPADGKLDVCYGGGSVPRVEALALLLAAKTGSHTKSKRLHFERVERVRLEFERDDYPIQADGEKILARSLDVTVVPHALQVLKPVTKQ